MLPYFDLYIYMHTNNTHINLYINNLLFFRIIYQYSLDQSPPITRIIFNYTDTYIQKINLFHVVLTFKFQKSILLLVIYNTYNCVGFFFPQQYTQICIYVCVHVSFQQVIRGNYIKIYQRISHYLSINGLSRWAFNTNATYFNFYSYFHLSLGQHFCCSVLTKKKKNIFVVSFFFFFFPCLDLNTTSHKF